MVATAGWPSLTPNLSVSKGRRPLAGRGAEPSSYLPQKRTAVYVQRLPGDVTAVGTCQEPNC